MSNFMYRTNGDGMMYGMGGGPGMMGAMMSETTASFEYQYLAQMKAFISKAYKNDKYCDLTLKTRDGATLKAHKLILASQCKYFMQKLDAKPDSDELEVTEVKKGEALKVIVDYIYTQKIRSGAISPEIARDVLKAGDVFKLEDVKEEAAIVMAKNLDEEIAVDVMTNNIFAGAVANNAFTFTANNFQLFLDKDHLKKRLITEIKPGLLCHLLSQKYLMLWDKSGLYLNAVEREKQLFFFVLGYVAHDVENRIDDLKSILHVLKLPLLIHHKILNVNVMGAGLKRPPEVLSGMLGDILDPYEKMTGTDNLATMFASSKKTGMSQSQRRLFADTCKMRYATVAHTCLCSDVARTEQPWAEKITFCPSGNDSRQTGYSSSSVIRSVTVVTCNKSLKEGEEVGDSNQWDRRVTGVKMKFEDGSEAGLGDTEEGHHTRRMETYDLEEGELVTRVHAHYPPALLAKKGGHYQSEIFSLTSIHDISFVTNKERKLGPMKTSDLPLEDGLTMKIPGKIKHHEKNCPGSFYWLQGFGMEDVKIKDSENETARSLFPIWGFKAHFKVYSVKQQEFEFTSGFKKHYQFSLEGLSENPLIDDLKDLDQLEKSPVHEVVDLDDESEESNSEDEGPGMMRGNEDSIMVVDSEEEEEDEESGEEGGYRSGVAPLGFGGKGGEDEPIEIESSSEEEDEVNGEKEKGAEDSLNGKAVAEKTQLEEEVSSTSTTDKRKRKESETNEEDTSQEPAKKSKDDDVKSD